MVGISTYCLCFWIIFCESILTESKRYGLVLPPPESASFRTIINAEMFQQFVDHFDPTNHKKYSQVSLFQF